MRRGAQPRPPEEPGRGGGDHGPGRGTVRGIEFEDGKILNPRFSDYRVPRFRDTPVLETVLLDRKDLPSAGAGETPIIGIAPAVGNAIFAATGDPAAVDADGAGWGAGQGEVRWRSRSSPLAVTARAWAGPS